MLMTRKNKKDSAPPATDPVAAIAAAVAAAVAAPAEEDPAAPSSPPLPPAAQEALPSVTVEWGQIKLDYDFNSRKEYKNIENLSEDIRDNGLISPIVITRDLKRAASLPLAYHVIAGFRRTLAMMRLRDEAKKAGAPVPFETLECKLHEGPEVNRWILNLRENMSREDLKLWEIGDQCVKIRDRFQMSGAQIGEKLRYQRSHVNNCIRVVESIATDVQDQFRKGQAEPSFGFLMTLASLRKADGKPDHDRQRVKWQEWITGVKVSDGDDGDGGGGDGDGGDGDGRPLKMVRTKEGERVLSRLKEALDGAAREEQRQYYRGGVAVAKYLVGYTDKIQGLSLAVARPKKTPLTPGGKGKKKTPRKTAKKKDK